MLDDPQPGPSHVGKNKKKPAPIQLVCITIIESVIALLIQLSRLPARIV